MPFTLVHGLVSYFFVCSFTKNRKLRLLAFIAGILPDLDGIPVLFDMDLFYQLHHELFHAPIYGILLAVPVAIILHRYFKLKMAKSFIVFSAAFILHPVTDVLLTNWPVKLLWPLSQHQFAYPLPHILEIILVILLIVALLAQIVLFILRRQAGAGK